MYVCSLCTVPFRSQCDGLVSTAGPIPSPAASSSLERLSPPNHLSRLHRSLLTSIRSTSSTRQKIALPKYRRHAKPSHGDRSIDPGLPHRTELDLILEGGSTSRPLPHHFDPSSSSSSNRPRPSTKRPHGTAPSSAFRQRIRFEIDNFSLTVWHSTIL